MGYCPHREFCPVGNPEFSKYPVQIFLDGSLREMQLVCDFLILFRFTYESYNLPLPKTQVRI
jgi:hypothetical protein